MTNENSGRHTKEELDRLYSEADTADAETFAEMRTNLLLISGEHYSKKMAPFMNRIRDYKDLSDQQKLRLVKNHIQKICKVYSNNVMSAAPGVAFEPKNDKELPDKKSAELHHSVWEDAKERYRLDEFFEERCDDLIGIGEAAVKIFFDPSGGMLKNFEQKIGEDGLPMFDENGQPIEGNPVYPGDFVWEPIFGFNLLRAPEARSMKESAYLIYRKMVDVKKLKAQFPQFADKLDSTMNQTVTVFDGAKGKYRTSKNEAMVKEYYFRACPQYPMGYFYITCGESILAEGEIPYGIFPIVVQQFEKIQTSPRGISPVKIMRPFQAEINRAASKMAEHQITLGDDKILLQKGASASQGMAFPGIRTIHFTGQTPEIMQGRDGSQYLSYMQSQIEELYNVMNVDDGDTESGQVDPYTLLFRAASQKKKFTRYIKRFERFMKDATLVYIQLAKHYMPDDMLVKAIGKSEFINISEFKNANDSLCEVKIVAQAEDVETRLGKQIFISQILQYTGGKLERNDLGKLIKSAPFGDFGESFSDFTQNYDVGTNIILALDRGEQPPLNKYYDVDYLLGRLSARQTQSDYYQLNPQVQQMYDAYIGQLEQIKANQLQQQQLLNSEMIPTGGYLVSCDFYVAVGNPADGKTKRVRLPSQAIEWTINRLNTQGITMDSLDAQSEGMKAEIAGFMGQPTGPSGNVGQSQPSTPVI